jgi:NodT family efflux transporter outer membrane factor (OMF) lipoprotein
MNLPRISNGLAILLVAACADLPSTGDRSPTPLPARYAAGEMPAPEVKDSLLGLFSNPQLSATVRRALANNPDLRRSRARLEEAGFDLRRSRSGLLPSLTGNSSAGRNKTGGAIGNEAPRFSASLDARWEVDVWGRIRTEVTAAEADQAAAAADFAAARQSLAAQTMQAWFDLVAATKSMELDQRRVASFRSTQTLVERRFELGRATLAEGALARTDLQNANADLESSRDRRDQAARGLRSLTGDYPNASLQAGTWPSLRRTVPAGLPSGLLRKRPDIAAAYQRIRAADARVHVAHADLFPSFTLTASEGRQSGKLSDLARSSFNSWSLLAGLSAPIFDGGQRRAELGAAGKRAEQAWNAYQATVLDALREVEDALGSERYLAREENARQAALDAAREAVDRTRRDYEAGITDFLSLLDAQRRVFATEQQTINLRAARCNNRVALALALGKGV